MYTKIHLSSQTKQDLPEFHKEIITGQVPLRFMTKTIDSTTYKVSKTKYVGPSKLSNVSIGTKRKNEKKKKKPFRFESDYIGEQTFILCGLKNIVKVDQFSPS